MSDITQSPTVSDCTQSIHAKQTSRKKVGRPSLSSKEARRIICIRWARLAHKAMRAKGIIPGQAGMLAAKRLANERKLLKQGQSKADLRQGGSNLEGI